LANAHWRLVRIQLDHSEATISILWDDPYGSGRFPQELKDRILKSTKENLAKLFIKALGHEDFVPTISHVEKTIDQQGVGKNSWDCGPIIVQNIKDYITKSDSINDCFNDYSIIQGDLYEQSIATIRTNHLSQYVEMSGMTLANERLTHLKLNEERSATVAASKLGEHSEQLQREISQLTPSKINILYALLESKKTGVNDLYDSVDISESLKYIKDYITPINLGKYYAEEVFDVNKANALLKSQKETFKKLHFAIGASAFAKIAAKDRTFVDKSMLISEIIKTSTEVSIITRPRRWGKTTNMDMLAKFFAIEVDGQGNEIPNSYRDLFLRLKIGQKERNLVEEHQGKYPDLPKRYLFYAVVQLRIPRR
jgi:hypothetical protein